MIPIIMTATQIKTRTNHNGGILGGITDGMPDHLQSGNQAASFHHKAAADHQHRGQDGCRIIG